MAFVIEPRTYVFSSAQASAQENGVYSYPEFNYLTPPLPPSAIYQTLSVSQFHCINGFYTVDLNTNQLIIDMTRLLIPPGWYTISTLTAEVQTLMRTVRASATCSYSALTGQVTLSSGDGYNMTVLESSCGALLGMLPQHTYSGAASYTFENLVDLLPCKSLIVSCAGVSTNNLRIGSQSPFLASIPVNAAPLGLITFAGGDECIIANRQSLSGLQLVFQDQNGAPLTFRTQFQLSLTLTIYHNPANWTSAVDDLLGFVDSMPVVYEMPIEETSSSSNA